MALEWAVGRARGRNPYRLADAVSSVGLGALSQTSAVFTAGLRVGLYALVHEHAALWRNDGFWLGVPGWLLALLFYDFCYYWNHRLGHEVAVLWAAHVVHHQSQDYNLSTALRQPSTYALLNWLFYLPMALAGVPPLVFVVVGLVDLLYQFWVHTGQVGRLGWFDRWFCSPSNHRVHHAVNDRYVDRNYGGILIVWDRLFGTFQDEDAREPCVYGTRGLLDSWDPLWANAQVYAGLARDSWHARRWSDKMRVWLKPPGWRPADVARRFPKPAFDIRQPLFDPPMGRALRGFVAVQSVLLLAGVAAFLWRADAEPLAVNAVCFAALVACQWALGAAMQGRVGLWAALTVQAAALSTATGALGLVPWHGVFKPLAMVFAIVWVAASARQISAGGRFGLKLLLMALLASLAGDVFLMAQGFFIPGLAAFLLAHLAYIALFKQGRRWFPHKGALLATLAVGAGMYAFLWHGGLPAALRAPVAAYVLAIALMAAQALGSGSRMAAAGALFFMLSDALLATNRFVAPLPLAPFWVLATYYAAQCLIVGGWLARRREPA
ncbi:MAG: lysoplasmalogenase family protein [Acidovorax sp.]